MNFIAELVFGSIIDSVVSEMSWGTWFLLMAVIGLVGCLVFCGG